MPFSAKIGFFSVGGEVVPNPFNFPTWNTAPSEAEYLTEVGSWSNSSVISTTEINTGISMNHRGILGAPNGNLYLIPRQKGYFVEIDPSSNTFTQMTTHGNLGTDDYTGGAMSYNGNIYLAPFSNGEPILEFDPVNDVATDLSLTGMPGGTYSYYGAYCLPSGNIIFQPRLGGNPYLKYEPGSSTILQLSETAPTDFGHSGGCVGFDGKFYACPQNNNTIRVYEESSNTWATFGTIGSSINTYTGFANGNDGKIVGVPHSYGHVVILDPSANTVTEYSAGDLGLSFTSTAYIGPTTGSDGKVYALPYNESDMLVVDTAANTFIQVATGLGGGYTIGAGATTDGYVYSARSSTSTNLLRVDTGFNAVNSYGAPYTNSGNANTIFSAQITHSLNKGP